MGELRRAHGRGFAPGFGDAQTLAEVLPTLDDHSLALVWRDHDRPWWARGVWGLKGAIRRSLRTF